MHDMHDPIVACVIKWRSFNVGFLSCFYDLMHIMRLAIFRSTQEDNTTFLSGLPWEVILEKLILHVFCIHIYWSSYCVRENGWGIAQEIVSNIKNRMRCTWSVKTPIFFNRFFKKKFYPMVIQQVLKKFQPDAPCCTWSTFLLVFMTTFRGVALCFFPANFTFV